MDLLYHVFIFSAIFSHKVSELNSKSYLLEGGTVIYSNSNLNDDKYKVPGNYYCNNTEVAASLQNAPFSVAFTLKVEQATGSSELPCQTARNYQTGAKAWREYNPYSKMWTNWIYFSDDATLLGQTIQYTGFTIPANGKATISESDSFYQLAIFRGSIGVGFNAALLTGYGIGGDGRYFYKLLDNGGAVDISVIDTSFVITNKLTTPLTTRIFCLYGDKPGVSIS